MAWLPCVAASDVERGFCRERSLTCVYTACRTNTLSLSLFSSFYLFLTIYFSLTLTFLSFSLFFHVKRCVILDNFELHCFGRNFDGQLGLGDQVDRGAEVRRGRALTSLAGQSWQKCRAVNAGETTGAVFTACFFSRHKNAFRVSSCHLSCETAAAAYVICCKIRWERCRSCCDTLYLNPFHSIGAMDSFLAA